MCSLEEQQEVVRTIEAALSWIKRLASETTNARKLIDHLGRAILAKAFQGELVPQDPGDEPASVVLDRIRVERGAKPAGVRGSNGQGKPSEATPNPKRHERRRSQRA